MAKAQAEHSEALAAKTDTLRRETEEVLSEAKAILDVAKDKHLRLFQDQLSAYREIIDLVSEVLDAIDHAVHFNAGDLQTTILKLNRQRIRIFGYTALVAPQVVVDRFTKLESYLLEVAEGQSAYVWETARQYSLDLLNEMRSDLNISPGHITYNDVR
ncbi:hypothetical protein ASL20_09580 [Cupriavidus necator]|nr:hypothetical protein ASL20_09580 [Cupriavidus necator]